MPEDHFGEEIAAPYDDPSDEMFQPAAIEQVVDFADDARRALGRLAPGAIHAR
jgi:hypothetical protein